MEHGTERLISVLNKAKNKISRLQKQKDHISEQDTKGILIEPVLSALGWDLSDFDDVRREYKHRSRDKPVDYALMIEEKPVLFLEAKAVHISLEDRKWLTQVVNYANTAGVQWCVLTNGNHYRLFNAHAPVDVEEKLLCEFKVVEDIDKPFVTKVLGMLQQSELGSNALSNMWDTNYIDKQVQQVVESFFDTPDDGLIRLIKRRLPELAPRQISNAVKRLWTYYQKKPGEIEPAVPTDEPKTKVARRKKSSPMVHGVTLNDIADAGIVSLPLSIEKTYKNQKLTAVILPDGQVEFNGKKYDSPSAAAGYARNAVLGDPPAKSKYWPTNGWSFWHFRDAKTGKLLPIDDLRQTYLASKKSAGLKVI